MFTGIITDIGRIATVERRPGHDLRLAIETGYDLETVAIGASIACSGVCLTVTSKAGNRFTVDVSGETVSRTASAMWAEGARLNLERSLKLGDELGGHIVTGHVDGIGTVELVDRDDEPGHGVTGDRDGAGYSAQDVVVAVIDTGIDANHIDLDGGKVIAWHDWVQNRADPYDDNGHGTHVAGTIGGLDDGVGVVGAASQAPARGTAPIRASPPGRR